VLPSLYDDFRIPILESFAYGCLLALSNTTCFPEIASNAGIYFKPESIDDINAWNKRQRFMRIIYYASHEKVFDN